MASSVSPTWCRLRLLVAALAALPAALGLAAPAAARVRASGPRVAPRMVAGASASEDAQQRKNPSLYRWAAGAAAGGPPSSRRLTAKPEVLSPAGGWAQARAAVANGADAIYFGVRDSFNARARAENFGVEELPTLMAYLHSHGVKGFCAVNVLIFDEELQDAEELVRALASAGVDALIVQDPAVCAHPPEPSCGRRASRMRPRRCTRRSIHRPGPPPRSPSATDPYLVWRRRY
jgi:hypothetical protein